MIIQELPFFVGSLITRLDRARSWQPRAPNSARPTNASDPANWTQPAKEACASTALINQWASGHGAWLLFHALTATTWTPFSIDQSPQPSIDGIARTLAIEFDTARVPAHRLRGLTNWWLRWAGERSHALCLLWQSELNALSAHRTHQRPTP